MELMALLPGEARWSFGGGTRPALIHQHRVSYDVDIFVTDAQLIPFLSPRLNDAAGAMIGERYVEASASLKVVRPEGDIDLIVAPLLTQPGSLPISVLGHQVAAQTASEILAKKILYRGHAFTHRDAFDLAMLLEHDEPSVELAEQACGHSAMMFLRQRLDLLLPVLTAELPDYVNPTASGAHLLTEAAPRIRAWLDS
jgi:hypothetical protein